MQVVTGATDGIGLALAKEIAKKGVNVVLVSRSMDKLKAAEKEIKDKCPSVETKVISFDFSKGSGNPQPHHAAAATITTAADDDDAADAAATAATIYSLSLRAMTAAAAAAAAAAAVLERLSLAFVFCV